MDNSIENNKQLLRQITSGDFDGFCDTISEMDDLTADLRNDFDALMLCANYNEQDMISELLSSRHIYKNDINKITNKNDSWLKYLILNTDYGTPSEMKFLANIFNIPSVKKILANIDLEGDNIFMYLAKNEANLLKELIENYSLYDVYMNNIDINHQSNDGNTFLHCIIKSSIISKKLISDFFEHFPEADVSLVDANNSSVIELLNKREHRHRETSSIINRTMGSDLVGWDEILSILESRLISSEIESKDGTLKVHTKPLKKI